MTERECSLCGDLQSFEEGELVMDTCYRCVTILDRERFLSEYEYGDGEFPEEF